MFLVLAYRHFTDRPSISSSDFTLSFERDLLHVYGSWP